MLPKEQVKELQLLLLYLALSYGDCCSADG